MRDGCTCDHRDALGVSSISRPPFFQMYWTKSPLGNRNSTTRTVPPFLPEIRRTGVPEPLGEGQAFLFCLGLPCLVETGIHLEQKGFHRRLHVYTI